jgi:hypothetical protein
LTTMETGSQAAFARRHGVSRQTGTDWKQRGLLVFAEDGKVDFQESDRALADHAIRQRSGTDGTRRMVDAEGREMWPMAHAERIRANYNALLARLKYERESAEVAEIDDVAALIVAEYALVRRRLHEIGGRVAERVASKRTAEEIKALVDAEVVLALNDLSAEQSQTEHQTSG